MVKGILRKIVLGGVVGLAGLGIFSKYANASPVLETTTTIHDSQDADLEREGIQIKYEWRVKNTTIFGNPITDSFYKYTINGDLSNFYKFDLPQNWERNGSVFERTGGDYWSNILPGEEKSFVGYIDKEIAKNKDVSSFGTAQSGNSNNDMITIPEPSALALLVLGSGAVLLRRKSL